MNIKLRKSIVAAVAVVSSVAMIAPSFAGAITVNDLLAQIAQLQAQLQGLQGGSSSTPAACVGVTFTRALVVGSVGNDVKCLQAILNANGFTVSASGVGSSGMESMNFGMKTLAAVRAFQASKGWTPANQVGPNTRAALNAWLATGSTGTGTGTGVGTSVGLTGTANIKNIKEMTQYSNEQVGEGESDVSVLGREIEMENSGNARLQQVRVQFDGSAISSPASQRLEHYAKDVSIWLNGKKVASASAADFNRDSTGVYTKTFVLSSSALLNAGVKNQLVVGVSAVDNLDSDDEGSAWDVNIENIRYVDATGAVITDSSSDLITTETVTFESIATAQDLELKLTPASDNPVAQDVKISTTSDTNNLTLLSFNLKAQGDKIWIDELPVAITTSDDKVSDVVSRIMLKLGSQTFTETLPSACTSASNCTVTFDDLNTWISADQTLAGMVVIDAKDTTAYAEGTTIAANITSTERGNITAEDANGNTIASGSRTGVVTGSNQTLRSTGLMFSNFTSSVASTVVGANSNGKDETFTVHFKVTAFGDTAYIPRVVSRGSSTTAGLIYLVENSAGTSVVPPAVIVSNGQLTADDGATLVNNQFEVPEGSSRTFSATITVSATGSTGFTSGYYHVQLDKVQFGTDSTDTTPNSSQSFTPSNLYETGDAQITLAS